MILNKDYKLKVFQTVGFHSVLVCKKILNRKLIVEIKPFTKKIPKGNSFCSWHL